MVPARSGRCARRWRRRASRKARPRSTTCRPTARRRRSTTRSRQRRCGARSGAALDGPTPRRSRVRSGTRSRARGRWDSCVPMRGVPTACCCRPPAWRARPGVRAAPPARAGDRAASPGARGDGQRVRIRRRQHQPGAAGLRVSKSAVSPGWLAGVRPERGRAHAFGVGWRGLAAFVRRGGAPAALEVPALAANDEPCEPRQRKLMSRAAYLGRRRDQARAARARRPRRLESRPPASLLYMGVGASGGEIAELEAMLRESVDGGQFDLGRFGAAGLTRRQPAVCVPADEQLHALPRRDPGGLQGPNERLLLARRRDGHRPARGRVRGRRGRGTDCPGGWLRFGAASRDPRGAGARRLDRQRSGTRGGRGAARARRDRGAQSTARPADPRGGPRRGARRLARRRCRGGAGDLAGRRVRAGRPRW